MDGPVSVHMDQCIGTDLECQHSVFDCEHHGRLRRLYVSNYPSKHKPVNHHDIHQSFYLPRYTGAGLCGIVIFVSWSFLQSFIFFGQSTYLFGMANFKFSIAFSYLDSSCCIRYMGIFQAELLHCSNSWVADQSIVDMSRPILDREC